jgi:hypothetical protein
MRIRRRARPHFPRIPARMPVSIAEPSAFVVITLSCAVHDSGISSPGGRRTFEDSSEDSGSARAATR